MIGLLKRTLILELTLNLLVGVSLAWAGPPTEIVKQVIEKALEALTDPASQAEARRQKAKRIVDPSFDYQEMAKRSLGPTWDKLSAGQRHEFLALFAQLLETSYADKIEKFAKRVKIDYAGETLDGDYAEVRTVVVRPNDRLPLNYRLINETGSWKVYDVVIEGVSLVSNYRSQFSRIISESSYAELVRRLKNKVSELSRIGPSSCYAGKKGWIMNSLNGEPQSHGMGSHVPRPTVLVVLVKPHETKEQAWRRHLKENPQGLCAEVKIFHFCPP